MKLIVNIFDTILYYWEWLAFTTGFLSSFPKKIVLICEILGISTSVNTLFFKISFLYHISQFIYAYYDRLKFHERQNWPVWHLNSQEILRYILYNVARIQKNIFLIAHFPAYLCRLSLFKIP